MHARNGILMAALLGLVLPASGGAAGESESYGELPAFQKADDNGDGSLTYAEIEDEEVEVPKEVFQAEDLDNDGELSKYDYKFGLK
jgi:Ca2+-binding EF-hand superfamily protein